MLTFVETPVHTPYLPRSDIVDAATTSLPRTASSVGSRAGRAGLLECRGSTSLFLATGCASPVTWIGICNRFSAATGDATDAVALLVLAYSVVPTRRDACSVLPKDFSARRPLFPCPSLALVRLSEPAPDYRAPFLSFVFGAGYPPQSLNPLLHLYHCHPHWID